MLCPYCSAPLLDGAKFCGACGKPVPAPLPVDVQPPVDPQPPMDTQPPMDQQPPVDTQPPADPQPSATVQAPPRKKGWRPWMTVTVIVLASLLGAAALFFGVWRVTQSLLREASDPSGVIEDWLYDDWGDDIWDDDAWDDDWYAWDDSDGLYYDDALENNWMMQVEGDDGEDMILMLSFDGEDVCLFVVTGAHTDCRGKYAYEYEGADAIYIPEFAQSFHYYVRNRGHRLILEPGIVLGGEYEEWTLAD